jgi:hypothetical protein
MKQLEYITDKYLGPTHIIMIMSERWGISNKKLLQTKLFYQGHSSKIPNFQTFQHTDTGTRQKYTTLWTRQWETGAQ